MKKYGLITFGVLCVLLIGTPWGWAAQHISISHEVISSSGEHLAQGNLSLDNTLGQPVIGSYNQDAVNVCVGFWCQRAVEHNIYIPLVLKLA